LAVLWVKSKVDALKLIKGRNTERGMPTSEKLGTKRRELKKRGTYEERERVRYSVGTGGGGGGGGKKKKKEEIQ